MEVTPSSPGWLPGPLLVYRLTGNRRLGVASIPATIAALVPLLSYFAEA